jgi:pilus assembly protein Flp/PilA
LQPPFYLRRRSRKKRTGVACAKPADYVSASILEVRCQWFTTAQPAKQNPQECPMKKLVVRFLNDHGGGTAIRPHRGGISIAIIAVVNTIGTNLNTTFSGISSQLK